MPYSKDEQIARMSAIKAAVDLCCAGKIEFNDIDAAVSAFVRTILGE